MKYPQLLHIGEKMNHKITHLNYIGLYVFTYFAFGSLLPLIAQYLLSIGLNGIQVGTIVATGMLSGLLSTPIWGIICDKSGRNKTILSILLIVPALLSLFLIFMQNYYHILIIYAALFIFQNSIFPVMDSLAIGFTSDFGKIRLWGSIGYALGVFISGMLSDIYGLHIIFMLYSCFACISTFFLRGIHTDKMQCTFNHFEGLGLLLKNRKYILFVFAAFFVQGPIVAHNTYFSVLYTYVGGSIAGTGVAFFLFCISEAPVMHFVNRLEKKLSIEKIIIIPVILSIIRWYWYSTAPSPALLLATFFIQGVINGIFLVMTIRYITVITKKEVRVTAISIYASVSNGIGAMVCQYFGGIILNNHGPAAIYFFYTLLNVLALLLFLILYKINRAK